MFLPHDIAEYLGERMTKRSILGQNTSETPHIWVIIANKKEIELNAG